MAIYSHIHLDFPEAARFKDLTSIADDFKRCDAMCSRVIGKPDDPLEIDALSISIPILYARPFNGGIRVRINEIVESVYDDEQRALHHKFLLLRSKHIAHSISTLEEQKLCVWLNPEEHEKKINNINVSHSYILSLNPENYQNLRFMLDRALDWIILEMEKEEKSVREIIEYRYTLDDLYSKEAELPKLGNLNDLNKGRRR